MAAKGLRARHTNDEGTDKQPDETQLPLPPVRRSSSRFFREDTLNFFHRQSKDTLPAYLVDGPYAFIVKLEIGACYVGLAAWCFSIARLSYMGEESDPYFGTKAPLHPSTASMESVHELQFLRSRLQQTLISIFPSLSGVDLSATAVLCFLTAWRSLCVGHSIRVVRRMLEDGAGWALLSYTLNAWGLMFLLNLTRLIVGAIDLLNLLAGTGHVAYFRGCMLFAAEMLRYPSLVTTITTFVVWWAVIAPVIHAGAGYRYGRKGFKDTFLWNFNFVMFSIHVLNLPFGVLETFLFPRELAVSDLFVGSCHLLYYVTVYLTCLDANMVHIYPPLNPRTSFSVLFHFLVFWIYFKTWEAFIQQS